jgi:hypothetical protein
LYVRQNGFGVRRFEHDDCLGRIEVLTLTPALATASAEQMVRLRAARMSEVGAGLIEPVHRIDRDDAGLHVVAGSNDGVPLSTVLTALEARRLTLSDESVLDIAAALLRTTAALHAMPGAVAHGAIVPGHVMLSRQGRVVFTDAALGSALEAMQRNRDHHWREFGLVLPSAASWPRFDRCTDVTQIGAVVLALVLRRPLRPDEDPRGIAELVASATAGAGAGGLRMWLNQSLQLNRATFADAAEADRAFCDIVVAATGKKPGTRSIETMVRLMRGDAPAVRPLVVAAGVSSGPDTLADRDVAIAPPAPPSAFELLRAVLPKLRAS